MIAVDSVAVDDQDPTLLATGTGVGFVFISSPIDLLLGTQDDQTFPLLANDEGAPFSIELRFGEQLYALGASSDDVEILQTGL